VIANATNQRQARREPVRGRRHHHPARRRRPHQQEIGALVYLSAHTIRDRLERIPAAFDLRSRAEIVAERFRARLI